MQCRTINELLIKRSSKRDKLNELETKMKEIAVQWLTANKIGLSFLPFKKLKEFIWKLN